MLLDLSSCSLTVSSPCFREGLHILWTYLRILTGTVCYGWDFQKAYPKSFSIQPACKVAKFGQCDTCWNLSISPENLSRSWLVSFTHWVPGVVRLSHLILTWQNPSKLGINSFCLCFYKRFIRARIISCLCVWQYTANSLLHKTAELGRNHIYSSLRSILQLLEILNSSNVG